MNNDINLISVNVGKLEELNTGKKVIQTGIFKYPVRETVKVMELGLSGDVIGNKKVHGGPGQAIYIYSMEDYQWWSKQLQRKLLPGFDRARVELKEAGALAVGISGSGPTLFALVDDFEVAARAEAWLHRNYRQNDEGFVHVCRADLGGARSIL